MVPSGHEGGACRRSAGRSAPRHWSHVGGGQHGVLNAHGRVGSSSLLPKHTRRVHAGSVPCSGRAVVGEVEGHPSDPEPVRWYWSTAPFIPHSQWVSSCTRFPCARVELTAVRAGSLTPRGCIMRQGTPEPSLHPLREGGPRGTIWLMGGWPKLRVSPARSTSPPLRTDAGGSQLSLSVLAHPQPRVACQGEVVDAPRSARW